MLDENFNNAIEDPKKAVQIKAVILLQNFQHTVSFISNLFSHNSGSKGIIYLEKGDTLNKGLLFRGNTFLSNTGMRFSNCVYIRF